MTPYSLFEVCRHLRGYFGPLYQEIKKKYYNVKSWQTFTGMLRTSETDLILPIPVAVQSKAYVFGRSTVGIEGSNPTEGMDVRLSCLLFVL